MRRFGGAGVTHVLRHEEHFLLLRLSCQVYGYCLNAFDPLSPTRSLSLSLSLEALAPLLEPSWGFPGPPDRSRGRITNSVRRTTDRDPFSAVVGGTASWRFPGASRGLQTGRAATYPIRYAERPIVIFFRPSWRGPSFWAPPAQAPDAVGSSRGWGQRRRRRRQNILDRGFPSV